MIRSKSAQLKALRVFLASMGIFMWNSVAEPQDFSDVVKETTRQIASGMDSYAGPSSTPIPKALDRSPEAMEWRSKAQAVRQNALEDMDRSVVEMILNGFKRGLSLDGIKARTEGCITWSEWPRDYNNLNGEPLGIRDAAVPEEEWVKPSNAVVVIHQSYKTLSGAELHFLQPTFRRRLWSDLGNRLNFSGYVFISENGEMRKERLYWSLDVDTFDRHPQKLLGFVAQENSEYPAVLMYTGSYGTAHIIDISYYPWVEEIGKWAEINLGPLDPVSWVAFDPDTTSLRCFGHLVRDEVTGENKAAVSFIWNLNEVLTSENHEIDDTIQKAIKAEKPRPR